MNDQFPIVYSAHHASNKYDYLNFDERCALNPEQRTRFSDYGTDLTVPQHGITPPLIATWSRGIADLNRNRDDCFKTLDYCKAPDGITLTQNKIWLPGMEPTDTEKEQILRDVYDPYYQKVVDDLRSLERHKHLMFFAWDNTADYSIGKNEAGETMFMPDFVISNRGAENSHMEDTSGPCKGEQTSCNPAFLLEFRDQLSFALKRQGLPNDVRMNLVYRGGTLTRTFSHLRHPELAVQAQVESLQLEYNTKITHNQQTLEPYPDQINRLRIAAEKAMEATYANVGAHAIGLPSVPASL